MQQQPLSACRSCLLCCADNALLFCCWCYVLQVRFSTKSFGLEAAQVAAEALLAVAHSLTHADMSDIIAGRPVRMQQKGQALSA
jgi:hypothetical protein